MYARHMARYAMSATACLIVHIKIYDVMFDNKKYNRQEMVYQL